MRAYVKRLTGVAAGMLALVALARVDTAQAVGTTFVVNNANDASDFVCAPGPGGCTLRDAIHGILSSPGAVTIRFDPAIFPPGFVIDELVPLTPYEEVRVNHPVTLDGTGAGVSINGSLMNRMGGLGDGLVFISDPGHTLSNLTLKKIYVHDFFGSGVHLCPGGGESCGYDLSGVTIDDIVVDHNNFGLMVEGGNISEAALSNVEANYNVQSGILINSGNQLSSVSISDSRAVFNVGNFAEIDVRADGDAHDVQVSNNEVSSAAYEGISVFARYTVSDVTIDGNSVSDIQFSGVNLDAGTLSSSTISGNTVSHIGAWGIKWSPLLVRPGSSSSRTRLRTATRTASCSM